MNCIYRSIWNDSTGTFVAAAENTHSAGKKASACTGSGSAFTGFAPKALGLALMLALSLGAQANPQGGVVAAGGATIVTGTGTGTGVTTINQSTASTVINWQSFNIGQRESVVFVQPNQNSVALNRVLGSDPSSILGNLTANGQVFLVNPSGILFGRSASVNVGGLVASTRDLSNSDFMAGQYHFAGNSSGTVVNQGTLRADGGYVALLGANVSNQGVIAAQLGTVALAAGNAMTLDLAGDGLLNLTVTQGALQALVDNGGLIQADGGRVLLTAQGADALVQSVVNTSGVIQAQTLAEHNGSIVLLGSGPDSRVTVGGTLDASGTAAGQTGGSISVSGLQVSLNDSARLNASGDAGGGTVLVGGNFAGAGPQPNAQNTQVSALAQVHADALGHGTGGRISIWSDGTTGVAGTLTARGGAQGGDGGYIETSGQQVTLASTARVDTLAPQGKTGLWLLDPLNWTISTGGVGGETTASVVASLTSSNRLILADNDITVTDPVTWSTAQTLTLNAGNDVNINAAITTSTAGSGLALIAGHDINQTAAITASGVGTHVTLTAVRDVNVAAAMTASGANALIQMTAGRDVNSTDALTASDTSAAVNLTAGRNVSVNVITASGGGSTTLRAGNDVVVNGMITADTALPAGSSPVTLIADTDGTGPGAAGGTVRFPGGGGVTAPKTTIRFNPAGYANTSAEIAAYAGKVSAILDAKAWVFVQGNDKPYDGNTTATLSFKGTPTDGGVVTLTPGTAAFDTPNVGSNKPINYTGYTISGADVGLFELFAGAGVTSANITPLALTITANSISKTYGQTPSLTGFTDSGLIGGETIGSVTEVSAGQGASASVVGGPYTITPSNATGGTFTPGNYTISYVNGMLTVIPAGLTVTADNVTKTYGQTPALTGFTETGLVNGETIGSVTEASAGQVATAGVGASPYVITASNATGGTFSPGNYTISYVNGALTVIPAGLTVTADNVTKTYGQTPALTGFTETGLVNGETIGSVTEGSSGQVATAGVVGSPYVITASNATGGTFSPGNYTISYVNGALTVIPASLTVTADNVTKTYGQTPALTGFTETGLVNGETIGSVTEASAGKVATAGVAGSPYVITASNATGGTFTPGKNGSGSGRGAV